MGFTKIVIPTEVRVASATRTQWRELRFLHANYKAYRLPVPSYEICG